MPDNSTRSPASPYFWHPLKRWHVIAIFAGAQLSLELTAAAASNTLGLGAPLSASGAAGFLGVVITVGLADWKRGS
jgi:hypothetical protein